MNYISTILQHISKLFVWWFIVQPWEAGIRTRFGKRIKVFGPGAYFKIPYFDQAYVQVTRLRIVQSPVQTVSTKDGHTLTIICALGFSISDIRKLYEKLHSPDVTITNMVLSEVAQFISQHDLDDCEPKSIEEYVNQQIQKNDYGIKYEDIKIVGYAVVKTYRLIQDQYWVPNVMDLSNEKKDK